MSLRLLKRFFHQTNMNEAAKALGSLGGKKRKENSTLEQRREWGKKGGRPKKIKNVIE